TETSQFRPHKTTLSTTRSQCSYKSKTARKHIRNFPTLVESSQIIAYVTKQPRKYQQSIINLLHLHVLGKSFSDNYLILLKSVSKNLNKYPKQMHILKQLMK